MSEVDKEKDTGEEDNLINIKPAEENDDVIKENTESKVVGEKGDAQTRDHSENVHYEGDVCVYTDPATKYQYTWSAEKSEWMPRSKDGAKQSTDNPQNPPDSNSNSFDSSKDYQIDGDSYIYKDKVTGVTFRYDRTLNEWVKKSETDTNSSKQVEESEESESDEDNPKEKKKKNVIKQDMTAGHYSFEGDTHLYTDPSDGTVYEWDREKSAWFPKVDEDFLAHYQMNYGFIDTSNDEKKKKEEEERKAEEEEKARLEQELKRKAAAKEPTWFECDDQHNTKVYVSNLPLDITEEEFVAHMQKCGLVMRDLDSGKMKIKLYTEPGSDRLKGDALCTYIKIESVELALKLLDGSDLKGKKLKVERAKFQLKGTYDPNLKPKKRRRKDKDKMKKIQEKLFDWRPDKLRGERSKHERVVIVKNLFEPQLFEKEVTLLLEYQQDLREECSKCGNVRKVVIYDRHPEGVAQITFQEPEEADQCVQLLNGRWFGQRKITAETWDGKTKYKITESEQETQKRLQKWNKFLETGKAEDSDHENSDCDPKNNRRDDSNQNKTNKTMEESHEDTEEQERKAENVQQNEDDKEDDMKNSYEQQGEDCKEGENIDEENL